MDHDVSIDHTSRREVISRVLGPLRRQRGPARRGRHASASTGAQPDLHRLDRRGRPGPAPAVPELPPVATPPIPPQPQADHDLRLTESGGAWSWTCAPCGTGRVSMPSAPACVADHAGMHAAALAGRAHVVHTGPLPTLPTTAPPAGERHSWTVVIDRAGPTYRALVVEQAEITAEGDEPDQALMGVAVALRTWLACGRPAHTTLIGAQLAGAVLYVPSL